jgi:hypothetical protein
MRTYKKENAVNNPIEIHAENIIEAMKTAERQRLLALALTETGERGMEVTGELHDALEERISLLFPALILGPTGGPK